MKKLFIIVLMLSGCVSMPAATPVKPEPNELVVTVEGDRCLDKETIMELAAMPKKSMSVENPELSYSPYCRISNGKAYIRLTSISSYGAESLWGDVQLMNAQGIKQAIIYMNNPGGSAFDGFGIYDTLRIAKNLGIRFDIEAYGIVASAAIPVLMIADHRVMSRNTVLLIHPAKIIKWLTMESLEDIESQKEMFLLSRNTYADIVAKGCKLSKDKIVEMLKKDTWFTAQQALEWGMVDEIK